MKFQTTRFGEIEVPEGEVLEFPEGLVGLGDLRRFALVPHPKGGPVCWLQSLEEPGLAWVVADPVLFFPEYRVKVRSEDLEPVRLADVSSGRVLVILTVRPGEVTANLQGPLVLNPQARLARQLVISEPGVTTRHSLPVEAK